MLLPCYACTQVRVYTQTDGQPENIMPAGPIEWRSAGTGLYSYRVRCVDGSCAKHLTIEFYTVVNRYAANIYT